MCGPVMNEQIKTQKCQNTNIPLSVYYKGRAYISFRIQLFIMETLGVLNIVDNTNARQFTLFNLETKEHPSAVIWIQQVLK